MVLVTYQQLCFQYPVLFPVIRSGPSLPSYLEPCWFCSLGHEDQRWSLNLAVLPTRQCLSPSF